MRTGLAALLAAFVLAPAALAQPTRPDFTGVWSNASVTQLNRLPGASGLAVPEAEAQRLAGSNMMVQLIARDARPSNIDDNLLADRNTSLGYNTGWMDPGTSLAKVKGEYRSSWIVDPANGQAPLSDAGRAAQRASQVRGPMIPDHPEQLAPNDRCLIASRGTGGPGMLNNIYNSHYQIVQTKDHLAIVVEMVHDVRAIPIFATAAQARAAHRPAALHPWLGDPVAWWEGQTLAIESTNVHPEQGTFGPIFLSPNGKVVERLTRVSPTEIFYAFEVEDPVYYTRPWKAEMTLTKIAGQIYEFACHEGNYGMVNILAGAREEERRGAGR